MLVFANGLNDNGFWRWLSSPARGGNMRIGREKHGPLCIRRHSGTHPPGGGLRMSCFAHGSFAIAQGAEPGLRSADDSNARCPRRGRPRVSRFYGCISRLHAGSMRAYMTKHVPWRMRLVWLRLLRFFRIHVRYLGTEASEELRWLCHAEGSH